MFKLTGKEINAVLGAQTILIWIYDQVVDLVCNLTSHHMLGVPSGKEGVFNFNLHADAQSISYHNL